MSPLVVFLSVCLLLVFSGLVFFVVKTEKEKKKSRRLAVITGQKVFGEKQSNANQTDRKRAEIAKKLKDEKELSGQKKNVLGERLEFAGFQSTDKGKFWTWSFISWLIGTCVSWLLGAGGIVLILLSITFLFGLPRYVLRFLTNRRRKKFLEEFADALESMMRLLKAGMPVGEAIAMVSREFGGPVGEEMSIIYNEQKSGVPMGEAVANAARRMPLPEMQMFATGIIIQQQTGASLSEILQNLATVIRGRFRLKRKVDALSAEAKASAGIIGALPIFVAVGLYFINTDYMILLFTTQTGKMLVAGSIFWMCVGVLIMKQMINFKV